MSTAWYIVDDEGNVGIMDYNENGPVPWGIEQTCAENLKYGHYEDCNTHKIIKFDLTDQQILDLLHEPHDPLKEDLWFDCVVKINPSKTNRFLELCKKQGICNDETLCVSENLGLYVFNAMNCVSEKKNKIRISGPLKTMLEERIIISVYRIQRLDMDDDYNSEKNDFDHSKEFDNSSYFMFHQPYGTQALPKKMHEPLHPVKIEQIPECFRYRLHKIPGNFKTMNTFQIAQHYPCYISGGDKVSYVIDGCVYQSSPLPSGNVIYTKTRMCEFDFFPFCSEKNRLNCIGGCSSRCSRIPDNLITDKPTVLIIVDPKENINYEWEIITDVIFQNSYATAYIPRFPKIDLKKDEKNIDYLSKVLNGSKGFIETVIKDINPRVILATDKAIDVLNNCYTINGNFIDVIGQEIPFYKLSSLEENRSAIEYLSRLPYQGTDHPLVITLEEMESLIKSGIAKEYKFTW